MSNFYKLSIAAAFLVNVFLCAPLFARAADVVVSPAIISVDAGASVSVVININSVMDLFSAAFDLIYDPAILSFASASKGSFLEQGGTNTTLLTAVNPAGDLIVGYSRQASFGVATGVNGSGALMTINFNALTSGISILEFRNNSLCAATGADCPVISAVWTNGSVAVGQQAAQVDASAPSIPANVSASAVSSSQIDISWTASTDNVGVVGYKIFRNNSQIATVSATNYSDLSLSAATNYSYTVSAYDDANNDSGRSNPISVTTNQIIIDNPPAVSQPAAAGSTGDVATPSSPTVSVPNTTLPASSATPSSPTPTNTTGTASQNNSSALPTDQSSLKEGDLIQGPDKIKTYIINAQGYKRHIFNPAIFNMYGHFKWNQIKQVDQATLDSFATSDIYRADGDARVFYLKEIDEANGRAEKRWFNVTAEKFISLGYKWDQIFIINPKERDYYQEGLPITENDQAALALPALVKTSASSIIYYVSSSGVKKPIQNEKVFNSYPANKWENIKVVSQEVINKYPDFDGIIFNGKVYTIQGGRKHWIKDENEFKSSNLNWNKIIGVNQTDFDAYPNL